MQAKKYYFEESLKKIPHILSWVDRDPYSATYGCFDRLFWGWKLKDFPDATLQRAIYPLAIVWHMENNIYHHSELVLRIIRAGLEYWGKMQHKSGAVDQAFPYEHSFGASAFSLNSIIKAYKIIESELSTNEQSHFKKYFDRCALFLVKADETHGMISNHLAGAAIALIETHRVNGSEKYLQTANKLIDRIIDHQSEEGWYIEYEGFDAGYQSLATYYLVQCWEILHSKKLLDSLKSSIEFLSNFIHPDGTIGGMYGSRNTENFYTAGFEIIRNEIPLAGSIADKVYQDSVDKKFMSLESMDPGNLIPLITNFLFSYKISSETKSNQNEFLKLPFETTCENYFPKANILVKSTEKYFAIVGISKGGVIQIFNKITEKRIWHDAGYIGQLTRGEYISSQLYSKDVQVKVDKGCLSFKTNFYRVLREFPTPFRFFILRFLNLTFMQNIWIGNFIKKQLVRFLISGKKSYSITLRRNIEFRDNDVKINDQISKNKNISLKFLHFGIPFTTIHMATSKYYSPEYLYDRLPHKVDIIKLNKENFVEENTLIKII